MTTETESRPPDPAQPLAAQGRATPNKARASKKRMWLVGVVVLLLAAGGVALTSMHWWSRGAAAATTSTASVKATTQTPTSCDRSGQGSRTSLCFGRGTGQVDRGALTLVGYFGSADGKGIGGARIELVASGRAGSPLEPTGMQTITDGSGRFAFAIITVPGSMRYAFRFAANGFYPSTASSVFSVSTSN